MMENFADAVVKGVFMELFVCSVVPEILERGTPALISTYGVMPRARRWRSRKCHPLADG